LGDLFGKGDKLLGQCIEEPEVLHLFFNLVSPGGGNALGTFLTLEEALKDEIGSRLDNLAVAAGFEELSTEGASAHVIDLFHSVENAVALRTKGLK
jgi:hypothetical protein